MRFDIIRLALSASLVFVVSAVPVPPDNGYTPLGHRYSNSNTGGGKQTTVNGVGSTGRTTVTSHFEPAGTSGQRNGPSQSWNTNTGTSHSSSVRSSQQYSNHNPGNYYIDLSIPISIQMRNVNTGIGSQNNFQGTGNQDNVFNRVPEDVGSSSHNANSRIDLSIPISIQPSNVNFGSGPQNNFQGTGCWSVSPAISLEREGAGVVQLSPTIARGGMNIPSSTCSALDRGTGRGVTTWFLDGPLSERHSYLT
ncbi:hypothetical protein C8R42DRAFT_713647 [Lentinula raphanica]|nr:hypothetical protein C8R42DRAFT_713647 [Lentinula raphanica]